MNLSAVYTITPGSYEFWTLSRSGSLTIPHMVAASLHLELPTSDCTNCLSQRVVFTGAC